MIGLPPDFAKGFSAGSPASGMSMER